MDPRNNSDAFCFTQIPTYVSTTLLLHPALFLIGDRFRTGNDGASRFTEWNVLSLNTPTPTVEMTHDFGDAPCRNRMANGRRCQIADYE